jgi:hypothetical protein
MVFLYSLNRSLLASKFVDLIAYYVKMIKYLKSSIYSCILRKYKVDTLILSWHTQKMTFWARLICGVV